MSDPQCVALGHHYGCACDLEDSAALRAEIASLRAEIARLREALTETLNLAIVADEGDYFYAEQAGIDSAAVIAKARAALGKEGT